jgi:hypothetical protein
MQKSHNYNKFENSKLSEQSSYFFGCYYLKECFLWTVEREKRKEERGEMLGEGKLVMQKKMVI